MFETLMFILSIAAVFSLLFWVRSQSITSENNSSACVGSCTEIPSDKNTPKADSLVSCPGVSTDNKLDQIMERTPYQENDFFRYKVVDSSQSVDQSSGVISFKRKAAGRFYLDTDGPVEFREKAVILLKQSSSVYARFEKEKFVKLMLDAGVPQEAIVQYLVNLKFTDDTYAVDPSTF